MVEQLLFERSCLQVRRAGLNHCSYGAVIFYQHYVLTRLVDQSLFERSCSRVQAVSCGCSSNNFAVAGRLFVDFGPFMLP